MALLWCASALISYPVRCGMTLEQAILNTVINKPLEKLTKKEIIRVLQIIPKVKGGKHKGKNVTTNYSLSFALNVD